jgi:hypothetical protein
MQSCNNKKKVMSSFLGLIFYNGVNVFVINSPFNNINLCVCITCIYFNIAYTFLASNICGNAYLL